MFAGLGKRKKMNCETRKRGKLCGKEECGPCFSRSFASCDKAKYMVEGQGNPLLIARTTNKKAGFVCPECIHSFDSLISNVSNGHFCPFCSNNKLCTGECETCFKKSFASHEKAKYWSSENNKKSPREVFKNSNTKAWFDCEKCSHSFEAGLSNVSKGSFCIFCSARSLCSSKDCRMCFEKSFAKHEKSKFWSFEKNNLTPRQVFAGSHKKFWFDCGDCGHSFKMTPKNVSAGQFCPFCSNNKICFSEKCDVCFKKSLANHEKAKFWNFKKNKKIPREVFMHSNKKFWFDCDKCNHSFESSPDKIFIGRFCSFCSNGKLCSSAGCSSCLQKSFANHQKANFWDFEKNEGSPREFFAGSEKKCWFKCPKGHEFLSILKNVTKGSWCPKCRNKTETKLLSFLEQNFDDVTHQLKVSWCKNPETGRHLPFDFCVSKTIVELDGRQHYEQVSNWQTPQLTQKTDRYKEDCAVKNGYSVLRILQEDVWEDRTDWKSLLLEHIKDYEVPIVKKLWKAHPSVK
uniref:Restriction endonuclease n=1 Tax=Marseillevirus sp. TaxID=2809551 RepID=A0AA96J180_9VIRU|nr:restriction endonuclease [Marseillevirus sp.]